MRLTTPVHISPASFNIGYADQCLLLGSCFTDAMASLFDACYMRVTANPFGTLFNPISIASTLTMTALTQPVEWGGLWHLMSHHGSFSSSDRETTVVNGEKSLSILQDALRNSSVIILTFGTAYVYEYEGQVVANCHKMPADKFVRRRLTCEQIVSVWRPILEHYLVKRFVFTVSPIRHLNDGLHENQLSKAVLLQSVDQLCEQPNAAYFPSYEILLDELRDYRFYADDLVHPSSVAVEIIWNRFVDMFMSADTQAEMQLLHQIYLDRQHTLLHPDTPEARLFKQHLAAQLSSAQQRYPWII